MQIGSYQTAPGARPAWRAVDAAATAVRSARREPRQSGASPRKLRKCPAVVLHTRLTTKKQNHVFQRQIDELELHLTTTYDVVLQARTT